jgi:hypothetical protein
MIANVFDISRVKYMKREQGIRGISVLTLVEKI